jgi:hypothetical protein
VLARFAKAAGAGEMLNIHDLERAYEPSLRGWASLQTVERSLWSTQSNPNR